MPVTPTAKKKKSKKVIKPKKPIPLYDKNPYMPTEPVEARGGGEMDKWFTEQTTPNFVNRKKLAAGWVPETPVPDVKFADPHRIVLNKNLKKIT